MIKTCQLCKVTLVIGIALGTISAFAQSTEAELNNEVTEKEEVVGLKVIQVTARRITENLQETPVSVVSFGAESLETRNISDLTNLSAQVPGVNIGAGGGLGGNNSAFFIRGLGSNRNAVNQESAVALYVDDFYYGRSDGALLGVVDVENIEILRGPQGTLFGRNATAGAIRYITKKPEFGEIFSKIKVDFGTDNKRNITASTNQEVGDDTAISLLAASLNQDGFVENAIGQELGEKGTNLFRGYLRTQATNDLEILAQVIYSKTDSNGGVSQALNIDPDSRKILSLASGDWNKSLSILDAFLESENTALGLTFNYALNDNTDLKWVTTYSTVETKANFDFDGLGATFFDQKDLDRNTDSYSMELQLLGAEDDLNWMTGLFYYGEESDDYRLQGSNVRQTVNHDLSSLGIFGQVGYALTDQFGITAGLRYTKDDKDAAYREGRVQGDGSILYNEIQADGSMIPASAPVTGNTIFSNEDSWGSVSGKFALEYQSTEDLFFFASYSHGYRAGGINDRPRYNDVSINYGITTFDEETLDVFELGMRSEWMDNRLRLNLTYYFQDMKDLQFSFALGDTTARAVGNAAEAEVQGLEGEITFQVSENLILDSNFGLMDSEITSADASSSITVGDSLAQSPELKYNIGGTYYIVLDKADVSIRVDYSYQDETYSELVFSNRVIIEDHSLVGFNINYTPAHGEWNASVYGTNITDEEYFQFATKAGPSTNGSPSRGAEYGVKFEYNF